MIDARTEEYFRQLRKTLEKAEEICQCADCARERMQKEMSQCDKNRLLQYLPEKIVKPMPSSFVPEASPDYELWKSGKRRAF